MKTRFKVALSLVLGFGALVGCSAADDISNSIDCHQVCERYRDCIKSDYDVDGCTDKCENSADNNDDRQRKLKMCDDCLEDRSCTDATFNCADDCVGIVP